jgi:hypothetical protein
LLISFNATTIAALLGNAANCLKFMMMATGSAHVWARLKSDGEVAACRMVGQVRVGKVRVGKVRVGKVRVGKVRVGKVRPCGSRGGVRHLQTLQQLRRIKSTYHTHTSSQRLLLLSSSSPPHIYICSLHCPRCPPAQPSSLLQGW